MTRPCHVQPYKQATTTTYIVNNESIFSDSVQLLGHQLGRFLICSKRCATLMIHEAFPIVCGSFHILKCQSHGSVANLIDVIRPYFKNGHSWPILLLIFYLFKQRKFSTNICAKLTIQVESSAGIQTHDLSIVSLPPLPLDQSSCLLQVDPFLFLCR